MVCVFICAFEPKQDLELLEVWSEFPRLLHFLYSGLVFLCVVGLDVDW